MPASKIFICNINVSLIYGPAHLTCRPAVLLWGTGESHLKEAVIDGSFKIAVITTTSNTADSQPWLGE
jgi:hypothetical protein